MTRLPPREEIAATLANATGWEAKNRVLVQMARILPPLPDEYRTEPYLISGCESQVWLFCYWQDGKLQLKLDSDSRIIRGLLVLVLAAYQGQNALEVSRFDFAGWLNELGLTRFLSASRGRGLARIVAQIHAFSLAESLSPT